MRMCIVFGRFSMCCPAGMSDTTGSRNRFSAVCFLCKYFQTPLCLDDFCFAISVANGDSGSNISTIFKLRQSIQKDWCCLMVSCKTYDSTHKYFSSSLLLNICSLQYNVKNKHNYTKIHFLSMITQNRQMFNPVSPDGFYLSMI